MRAFRAIAAGRLGLCVGAMILAASGCGASFAAGKVEPAAVPAGDADAAARACPAVSRTGEPASPAEARLGEAVFNTLFVPAGTPGAARHSGLGPLFDAASCDECHNGTAQARGPFASGPAPTGLIIELEEPEVRPGRRPAGDPRYGFVLSTRALPGVAPEAQVVIRYRERHGRYPDGTPFTLRVPRYLITHLGYGPLAPRTRIEPRLAPSLFGVGWLARVPALAIVAPPAPVASVADSFGTFSVRWRAGREEVGRFGWQGSSVSVRDQTAKALARDMGVTSREYPSDDCTAVEVACRGRSRRDTPEISNQLVDALVAYQLSLAPPGGAAAPGPPAPTFVKLGCAACHHPRLPVKLSRGCGPSRWGWIAPYTDLRLHFLGPALDDRNASGRPVSTRWRTAPLWNLANRRHTARTLLHDGRARSIEEAILWHGGEASASRARFMHLTRTERRRLLEWLGRL